MIDTINEVCLMSSRVTEYNLKLHIFNKKTLRQSVKQKTEKLSFGLTRVSSASAGPKFAGGSLDIFS